MRFLSASSHWWSGLLGLYALLCAIMAPGTLAGIVAIALGAAVLTGVQIWAAGHERREDKAEIVGLREEIEGLGRKIDRLADRYPRDGEIKELAATAHGRATFTSHLSMAGSGGIRSRSLWRRLRDWLRWGWYWR